MKRAFFTKFICLFLISSHLWGASNEGRGGGNGLALEFVDIGESIFKELKVRKSEFPEINLQKLRQTMDEVKVFEVDKVDGRFLGEDVSADAVFDATKKEIYISLNWARRSIHFKRVLVLHEYLGIMGIEVNVYTVSSRLIRNLPEIQEVHCVREKVRMERIALDPDAVVDIGWGYDAFSLTLDGSSAGRTTYVLTDRYDLQPNDAFFLDISLEDDPEGSNKLLSFSTPDPTYIFSQNRTIEIRLDGTGVSYQETSLPEAGTSKFISKYNCTIMTAITLQKKTTQLLGGSL